MSRERRLCQMKGKKLRRCLLFSMFLPLVLSLYSSPNANESQKNPSDPSSKIILNRRHSVNFSTQHSGPTDSSQPRCARVRTVGAWVTPRLSSFDFRRVREPASLQALPAGQLATRGTTSTATSGTASRLSRRKLGSVVREHRDRFLGIVSL